MKLLSKKGISVAPPERKTSTSMLLPAKSTSTASTAVPAASSAVPATSLSVSTAVPAAVSAAAPVVSDISPTVHALNTATTNQKDL